MITFRKARRFLHRLFVIYLVKPLMWIERLAERLPSGLGTIVGLLLLLGLIFVLLPIYL